MDHPTIALTLQILAAILKVLHHGHPSNRFCQNDLIPLVQDALGNARRSYSEVAAVLRCAVDAGFLTSSESNDTTFYQLPAAKPVDTQAVPQTPSPLTTPRDLWDQVHAVLVNTLTALNIESIYGYLRNPASTAHHQIEGALEWASKEGLVTKRHTLVQALRYQAAQYALTDAGRSWKPVDTGPVHDICGIPHATWALFDSVRYPGESAVATIERLLAKHFGAPGKVVEPTPKLEKPVDPDLLRLVTAMVQGTGDNTMHYEADGQTNFAKTVVSQARAILAALKEPA